MKKKLRILMLAFVLACVSQAPKTAFASSASASSVYLNETSIKLQRGNTLKLTLTDSSISQDMFYWNGYGNITWSSSNESIATVDQWGYVTIVGTGFVKITANYEGKNYTCRINAVESAYKVSPTTLTMNTYETKTIKMKHTDNVTWYDVYAYQLESDGTKTYASRAFYVDADTDTGVITITAKKAGNYILECIAYVDTDNGEQTYAALINASVNLVGLEETQITCALGTTRTLTYAGCENVSFSSSDPSVVTVNKNGKLTPTGLGEASITMTGTTSNGTAVEYECYVTITDPIVTLNSSYVLLNDMVDFTIKGDSYDSEIIYHASKPSILQEDSYGLTGIKVGTSKLSVSVDGKKFWFTVDVINPSFSSDSYLLTAGSSKKIAVQGLTATAKKEKITYSVGNTNVATVDAAGKVTAKKAGNTVLTAKIGDITLKTGISVGSKNAVNAINKAYSAIGSIYSQENRMQEGYYDCSSLIWRSYSPFGVTFGASSYAPTAAELARYLVNNKKAVAYTYTDPKKLQPGDLIFYGGSDNGRFMNIYHVSMFTGITADPYYSYLSGTSYDYTGKIVHASSGTVLHSTFTETYGNIVLIARPGK
ncbi:MAG: hypothetical protein E7256_14905 [Lachnospiraceae bacterium]|nr:hypothetical protein [Lachnospiraceae bacterium]